MSSASQVKFTRKSAVRKQLEAVIVRKQLEAVINRKRLEAVIE
jgi:hypothetical protein